MSRKFRNHYQSFNRNILTEFMSEEELNELDKKYSKAKLKRLVSHITTGLITEEEKDKSVEDFKL